MKDVKLYLVHIAESIERIEEYTSAGKESFFSDKKTQDAVMRNLQTLAESTKRIPDDMRASHKEIDWRAIAGFRNIAVHDYLGVSLDQIWDIVERDLTPLKSAVKALLGSNQ